MKKRLLALLLALSLCFSMAACAVVNTGEAEGEETKEEAGEKKKESYGTTAIYFGETDIKAGKTVKDLYDKGVYLNDDVLAQKLAPLAHTTVLAEFKADGKFVDTVVLGVLNTGEAEASLSDCMVYRITVTGNDIVKVSLKNGLKPGLSTSADAKNAYDSKYLIGDKTYGTSFNNISFSTDSSGTIVDITAIYLSPVLSKADLGEAKVTNEELTGLSILAKFTDVSNIVGAEYTDLSAVLGTSNLKFLLEGKEIVLGESGDSQATLTEKGFAISLDGTLKANTGASSEENITLGDKIATAPIFRNYTDADIPLAEAKLCGLTMTNEAYENDDTAYMDFNIYGITQSSSAAEIISRFGKPESIITNLSTLKTSLLYYCTGESTKYFMSINIDALSGEIASITISGYAN